MRNTITEEILSETFNDEMKIDIDLNSEAIKDIASEIACFSIFIAESFHKRGIKINLADSIKIQYAVSRVLMQHAELDYNQYLYTLTQDGDKDENNVCDFTNFKSNKLFNKSN